MSTTDSLFIKTMSEVDGLLEQLLATPYPSPHPHPLAFPLRSLPIAQLQQILREMSHLLYQRTLTASHQLSVLGLMKVLLLQGGYSQYTLMSVHVFPWLESIHDFHGGHPIRQRSALYLKENQMTGRADGGNYQRMFGFVEEYLWFLGKNMPYHPMQKHPITSKIVQTVGQIHPPKNLSHFSSHDIATLQSNLARRREEFRGQLANYLDFISQTVNQCVMQTERYHDHLFLLISVTDLADSFSISTIVHRLSGLFAQSQLVMMACQVANHLINTAEVEVLSTINAKCLPLLLEYILPLHFKSKKIVPQPKQLPPESNAEKLVDYFYLWLQKTKRLQISTNTYEIAYGLVLQIKKPFRLNYINQLRSFDQSMEKKVYSNTIKRRYITDQHVELQQNAIQLLRELSCCVSGQLKRNQAGYPNVLDSLTASDAESDQPAGSFSQSLLKSKDNRERQRKINGQESASFGSELLGPPKKMFKVEKSLRRSKSKEGQLTFAHKQRSSMKNIYTGRESSRSHAKSGRQTPSEFTQVWKNSHASFKVVQERQMPIVTAGQQENLGTYARQQAKDSLSFASSQFSQKDNNNQIAGGLYSRTPPDLSKNDSGQFLYFDKDSQIKSSKEQGSNEKENGENTSKSIAFTDSYDRSTSQYVLEYGTDVNARIPNTVRKPKFSFKKAQAAETISLPKDTRLSSQGRQLGSLGIQRNHIKEPILQGLKTSPRRSDLEESLHLKQPSPLESISGQAQSVVAIVEPFQFEREEGESKSSIYQKEAEGHLFSESARLSSQSSIPLNFMEVCRDNPDKKRKKDKSSILFESRSLGRMKKLPSRRVEVANFKELRELQNELGQLKAQTKQYTKMLSARQKQLANLQQERQMRAGDELTSLKKENQLIKILLDNQLRNEKQKSNRQSSLARELKQSSVKNMNMDLRDYNPQVLKLKLMNTLGHSKEYRKQIISNRCVLLNNHLLQIGYSYKHETVTLYFTLKQYCQSMDINLINNSVEFQDAIQRHFEKVYVGKQMKFKTEVRGTKNLDAFVPSILEVNLSFEHHLELKKQSFNCVLPLTPYNMAKPLTPQEALFDSRATHVRFYITPLYNSSHDLIRKGKSYLQSLFPCGEFSQQDDLFTLYFEWKGLVEKIVLKLKERAFRIEGAGHPTESGRQLIQSVINMLIDQRVA